MSHAGTIRDYQGMLTRPPMQDPPATDEDRQDLLAFQADGGRQHLDALWRRNAEQFWRLARGLCGDLADDALQEAALCLLRHADRWRDRGPGSGTSWLMTIVANAARKQKRRVRRAALPMLPAEMEAETPSIPADHERSDEVRQALERLDRRTRQAVELRYLAGLDFPAVAAALGVPVRTARTRVSRALATLRQRLGIAAPGGSSAVVVWLAPTRLPSPPATVADLAGTIDLTAGGPDLAALLPAALPKAGLLLGGASAAAISALVLGAVHLAPAPPPAVAPAPMPAAVVADPPAAPPAADAAAAVLRQTVTVALHSADLDEALLQIDRQLPRTGSLGWTLMAGSDYRHRTGNLSGAWSRLPSYGRVDLVLTAPLAQVLDQVTAAFGLAWERHGDEVRIVRRSTPQERAAWAATWRDAGQDQRRRLGAAGAAASAGDVQALQFLVMTVAEARPGWGYALVELDVMEFSSVLMFRAWHQRSVFRLLPEPAALDPFFHGIEPRHLIQFGTHLRAHHLVKMGAKAGRPKALDLLWSIPALIDPTIPLSPSLQASLTAFAEGKRAKNLNFLKDSLLPGDASTLRRCLDRALIEAPDLIAPFLGGLLRCGEEPAAQALAAMPRPLAGAQRQAVLCPDVFVMREVLWRLPWNELKALVGEKPEADGAYALLQHPAAVWDADLFARVLAAGPGNPGLKAWNPGRKEQYLRGLALRWPREVAPALVREAIGPASAQDPVPAIVLGRIAAPAGLTLPIAAWDQAPVERRTAARLGFLSGQGAPELVPEAIALLDHPVLGATAARRLVEAPALRAGDLLACLRREELSMQVRMSLITGIVPRLPHAPLAQWLLEQDMSVWAAAEQKQGFDQEDVRERPTYLLITHLARLAAIGDPAEARAAISRVDALVAAGPDQVRARAWRAAKNLRDVGLSDLPLPPSPFIDTTPLPRQQTPAAKPPATPAPEQPPRRPEPGLGANEF